MKRRIGGLIRLAVWVVLAYVIWEHLGGGEGLTRNLGRNTLLGLLLPWGIYCLVLLFGSPKAQSGIGSGITDRIAEQMKTEALPQNIDVRRSCLGGLWFQKWRIDILPLTLKLRSKNGKKEYHVSRNNAGDSIHFDRGIFRQIYITCDDGHNVNILVNKQSWKKLDWWVNRDWGKRT